MPAGTGFVFKTGSLVGKAIDFGRHGCSDRTRAHRMAVISL